MQIFIFVFIVNVSAIHSSRVNFKLYSNILFSKFHLKFLGPKKFGFHPVFGIKSRFRDDH